LQDGANLLLFITRLPLFNAPLFNSGSAPYLLRWRVLSPSLEDSILVAYLFERELALRLAVA
jgi:hypothetical protein